MNTHTKNCQPKVVDEKEDNEVEIEIELNETEFDNFNMPSSSINESFENLDEFMDDVKFHPEVVDEKEDDEVEIEIELNETEFDDFNMTSSSINESCDNLDESMEDVNGAEIQIDLNETESTQKKGSERFECAQCMKLFSTKKSLELHITSLRNL